MVVRVWVFIYPNSFGGELWPLQLLFFFPISRMLVSLLPLQVNARWLVQPPTPVGGLGCSHLSRVHPTSPSWKPHYTFFLHDGDEEVNNHCFLLFQFVGKTKMEEKVPCRWSLFSLSQAVYIHYIPSSKSISANIKSGLYHILSLRVWGTSRLYLRTRRCLPRFLSHTHCENNIGFEWRGFEDDLWFTLVTLLFSV
jgi:hypothetical protein